jgi:hypothetical protein
MRRHGVAPAVCDARRHEIHVEVLGYDKSHTKFTKQETNEVLKRFRELSGSINLMDYKRGSRLYVIRQLAQAIDAARGDKFYSEGDGVQGIVDQMDAEGRLASGPLVKPEGQTAGEFKVAKWDAELRRETTKIRRLLHELEPKDLDKVIIALRKHEDRCAVLEPEVAARCNREPDPF